MVVKVVLTKEFLQAKIDELKRRIANEYNDILGEDMAITVEFVDQMPTTEEDKKRWSCQNYPA